MTFNNKTDFPDFTEVDQSGNGVIFSSSSLAAGTYGPFYIGNLAAVAIQAQPLSSGILFVDQFDTPTFGGFPWGEAQYDMTGVAIMYDEIKVAAPYMFFVWGGTGTLTFQAMQSRGSRGAPAFNVNNVLFEDRPFTLAANAASNFPTGIILPGPATATAVAGSVGVPVLKVFDTSGGTAEAVLAYGVGAPANTFGSGCTVSFVASNQNLIIQVGNIGAADTNFSVSVVSARGY